MNDGGYGRYFSLVSSFSLQPFFAALLTFTTGNGMVEAWFLESVDSWGESGHGRSFRLAVCFPLQALLATRFTFASSNRVLAAGAFAL